MNKEFVPYEQGLDLKELGFDEPCFATYNVDKKLSRNPSHDMEDLPIEGQPYYWNNSKIHKDNVAAPLFQQAFRWFREKYNLYAEPYTANMGAIEYCFQIRDLYSEKYIYDNFQGAGSSYVGTFNIPEEAELACLDKLIEIVKSK
jgi:hypothetical protein